MWAIPIGRTGTARWLVSLAAGTVIAVLLLTGCARYTVKHASLSPSDVIGSWCAQAGHLLTVKDDETFQLANMSGDIYQPVIERLYPPGTSDRPTTTDPTSASGSWYLVKLQELRRLKLSVDTIDEERVSFNITLIGAVMGGEVVLLFYASDPDLGHSVKFTRCEEPQPQPQAS